MNFLSLDSSDVLHRYNRRSKRKRERGREKSREGKEHRFASVPSREKEKEKERKKEIYFHGLLDGMWFYLIPFFSHFLKAYRQVSFSIDKLVKDKTEQIVT